jgi:hypothetical protein
MLEVWAPAACAVGRGLRTWARPRRPVRRPYAAPATAAASPRTTAYVGAGCRASAFVAPRRLAGCRATGGVGAASSRRTARGRAPIYAPLPLAVTCAPILCPFVSHQTEISARTDMSAALREAQAGLGDRTASHVHSTIMASALSTCTVDMPTRYI